MATPLDTSTGIWVQEKRGHVQLHLHMHQQELLLREADGVEGQQGRTASPGRAATHRPGPPPWQLPLPLHTHSSEL